MNIYQKRINKIAKCRTDMDNTAFRIKKEHSFWRKRIKKELKKVKKAMETTRGSYPKIAYYPDGRANQYLILGYWLESAWKERVSYDAWQQNFKTYCKG